MNRELYSAKVMDLANKCKNPIVRSAILSGMMGGDNSARLANRRLNRECREQERARAEDDRDISEIWEIAEAHPETMKVSEFRKAGIASGLEEILHRRARNEARDARRALSRFRRGEGV